MCLSPDIMTERPPVLSLNKDGSVGEIVDGVFDKGYGSVAERNFRPHVTCTRRMPDGKYVLSVDNGIDQVKIYRFNEKRKNWFRWMQSAASWNPLPGISASARTGALFI